MPNHVLNRITPDCDEKKRREIMEAVKNDEAGIVSIDFQKIIPMPESLNIESGSNTRKALGLYQMYLKANESAMAEGRKEELEKHVSSLEIEYPDAARLFALGKQYYENTQKYGSPTWYEWAPQNWGTKWNAYDFENVSNKDSVDSMTFHTAWSAAIPVLKKLSAMYPDASFQFEWADEDIGYNLGSMTVHNGEVTESYLPAGGTLEAYKLYESITGESLEDIGFVYNEKTENFEWPDEIPDVAPSENRDKSTSQER